MRRYRNRQKAIRWIGLTVMTIIAVLFALPTLGISLLGLFAPGAALALGGFATKGIFVCAGMPLVGARILRSPDPGEGGHIGGLPRHAAGREADSLGAAMSDEQFKNHVVAGIDTVTMRTTEALKEIDELRCKEVRLLPPRVGRYIGAATTLVRAVNGLIKDMGVAELQSLIRNAERVSGLNRSALTSTDIPMPVQYATQIAQLADQLGAARRWGTVFPLSKGNAKLPRLKTSPAFALIHQSTAIPEKSPQTEWVTLAARKWGGLIRLPSEMDEDAFEMIGTFIALYAAREMAKIEDTVYFLADGTATYDSVTGLIPSLIALDQVYQQNGASPAEISLTSMRTLRGQVASAALNNAAYYMHRSHEGLLSGFNGNGSTFFSHNPATGEAMLEGFPVRWVDVMPVFTASDSPAAGQVVFGDLRFHWLGVVGSVMKFSSSTHAAFETDEVLIRAVERFDIGLMADEALAVLQMADS